MIQPEITTPPGGSLSLSTISSVTLTCIEEPILFKKDPLCPDHMILLSLNEKFILKISNQPESTESCYLKLEYMKTPSNRPVSAIIRNFDMVSAYKNSNILNKQTLSLDPLYAAEFSEHQEILQSQIIHVCFVKDSILGTTKGAVVTNFGQCEIIEMDSFDRSWQLTTLKINNLWHHIFPSSNYTTELNKFENIQKYIEDYVIKTCCWIDPNSQQKLKSNILICCTISGWLTILDIEPNRINYISKYHSDLYQINHVQSYSYITNTNNSKTMVLVGNIYGQIKLFEYEQQEEKLIEIMLLWQAKDKLTSKSYEINYCNQNELLIIVAAKSLHILIFILTSNNQILFTLKHLCDAQITGFDYINPYEYLICTFNGVTTQIKLIREEESTKKFSITCHDIQNDFESENYSARGMIATKNLVGWIVFFFPEKNYVPIPLKKELAFINIHIYNQIDSLNLLKSLVPYEYQNMRDYTDCLELIRLIVQQKKDINRDYIEYQPTVPVQFTEKFLHQLRLRLAIVKAIGGYKFRSVVTTNTTTEFVLNAEINHNTEYFYIITTIKAIWAYTRLEYINNNIEKPNEFQKQVATCMRNFLLKYIKLDLRDNYLNIQQMSKKTLEIIIEKTQNISEYKELCPLCSESTIIKSSKCSHLYPKCSITFIQISKIEMKGCDLCKSVVLDNDDLIRSILKQHEKIKCIFCGILMH